MLATERARQSLALKEWQHAQEDALAAARTEDIEAAYKEVLQETTEHLANRCSSPYFIDGRCTCNRPKMACLQFLLIRDTEVRLLLAKREIKLREDELREQMELIRR